LNSHVSIVDHPLVAARLSILRAKTTATELFRRSMQELSKLLLAEAARSWSTSPTEVVTPLRSCTGVTLAKRVVLVPILRAGLGMVDGMLPLLPDARIGHLGLYRDETTLRPVTYYSRLPKDLADAQVLLLDPMLATGHSACEAASILKQQGAKAVQFVCVVACDVGIAEMQRQHPEIQIIAAAVDPELNQSGYIVPGLGDAGDRYFGTG
jgi:uracil phosphoribosyltransferase